MLAVLAVLVLWLLCCAVCAAVLLAVLCCAVLCCAAGAVCLLCCCAAVLCRAVLALALVLLVLLCAAGWLLCLCCVLWPCCLCVWLAWLVAGATKRRLLLPCSQKKKCNNSECTWFSRVFAHLKGHCGLAVRTLKPGGGGRMAALPDTQQLKILQKGKGAKRGYCL